MGDTLSADVVIVGAGVAGPLVAHQMALAGASVLVLEAGPRLERWRIVENYRNTPAKDDFMAPYPSTRHAPHPEYTPENDYLIFKGSHKYNSQYIRAVGGTTWHWAASAWRLLPNDFRMQSTYGVGRDWPIGYDDLEPYYFRAEQELGVSGPNDGADLGSPRKQPYPMDHLPLSFNDQRFFDVLNGQGFKVAPEPVARNSRAYDQRPNCCGNNNCMPICPIAAMYSGIVHVEKAERAGARILANAVVYRIEVDDRNHVLAVHYKEPGGLSQRVTGKHFVLAANGIETPKLMLLSTSARLPNGVGNSSDQVGRNLMDHPGTGVTFQANEDLWPGRGPMELTSIVDMRDGPFRSDYAGKKLHLNNMAHTRHATQAAIGLGLVGQKLNQEIRRRAARTVNFNSFHDILPNPQNRIRPSSEHKDAMDIAQPEITYAIDDYVKKSAVRTHQAYARIAQLFGGTEITFDDDFAPNNHIMGSLIMGADPRNSVVDRDCRTHDHDNLYIAGSAVMPEDTKALVTYLRSVPAIRDKADSKPRFAWGAAASDDIDLRGVAGVITSSVASGPAELFSGHCASCHSASGSGSPDGFYPSLMNNSALGARDPSNLVMVMLHGVSRNGKDGVTFMPGFADHLSDAQIASLSNYLLTQFGNGKTRVDEAFVARQRAGGPPSPLPKLMLAGAIAAGLVLLLLIGWLLLRRKR